MIKMSAADPGISRKKRKCGKKFRKIENILGTQEVYVHCVYNCGRTYRTMQYPLDKKAWNVTLRKLNAHESQRCPKMTINTNSASPKRKKISYSQRAPKIEEVKHFIHFMLAQLRWQHGMLVGSFEEFDEEAARHNYALSSEKSVDNDDLKAMKPLMSKFFSRWAKGDRWVPFFPILGDHELYIVKNILNLEGLSMKQKYALSCAFSGSRWPPLFGETILCLFKDINTKGMCDEAKLMFQNPEKAFERGGAIHKRFNAYRKRGGKLHTNCFSPRPIPRGASGDEYTFYILVRTRIFFMMGLGIFDRLGLLKEEGGWEAVDAEIQKTKYVGSTLSKMFLISTHFALPNLHLLDEGIEVGVGAQESFKKFHPGIQAEKDYSPLPDRREILVSILNYVRNLVTGDSLSPSVEPRLIPMIRWCAQRAREKFDKVILPENFKDYLDVLNFQVVLCEWRKFRNRVDFKKKAGRGMSL